MNVWLFPTISYVKIWFILQFITNHLFNFPFYWLFKNGIPIIWTNKPYHKELFFTPKTNLNRVFSHKFARQSGTPNFLPTRGTSLETKSNHKKFKAPEGVQMNLLLWEITIIPGDEKIRYPNFVENFNRDPKRAHFLAEVARSITSQTESFWVQNDRPTESYISIRKKNMWRKRTTRPLTEAVKYSNSSLQKYPKMEKKLHPDEEKNCGDQNIHPLFRERWLVTISVRGWRWKKSSNFRPQKLVIWRLFHAIISWRDWFFEPTGMMREQLSAFKKQNIVFFYTINGYVLFICVFLWAWFWDTQVFKKPYILLMEEILHQLMNSLSRYLQGFIHPRLCRISSINSRILLLSFAIPFLIQEVLTSDFKRTFIWATKKKTALLSIESWLFNRDSYDLL